MGREEQEDDRKEEQEDDREEEDREEEQEAVRRFRSSRNLELVATVVHGGHPAEAVLEGLVHLLVPLAVSDHLLLLCKVLALAHWHGAVEVFPVVHVLASHKSTLKARPKPLEIPGKERCKEKQKE